MRARLALLVLTATLAGTIALIGKQSRAQSGDAEKAFFKGKVVKLIVGSGTGGGFDGYARMIAPYIAKALGGSVIVENQPGAGGISALDKLLDAPPDGLTIMFANGSAAALAQLVGQSGVRYDIGKFGHLGTVIASPVIWLVSPHSPIAKPEDAMASGTRITWLSSGPIDGLSDSAAFACAALHLSCRIAMGYPSSGEAALAVGRGQMDAMAISDISAHEFVAAGHARAVAAMGRRRSPLFPDTPTIFESVALDSDQAWLFDFHDTLENLGRILIAPPNLAPARLAVLQAAVKQALEDPALIAEGERAHRPVVYTDAEANRKTAIDDVDAISPEQRQRVKSILTLQ
ncbi:MAG TPA: tripartite tricarboxylate transporter substrate-binding protein [Beijerinckiaceae bacterium]|nr:tripartite tricarboxylate transporter substrate-binding protein [Beijerinckiaceae bacterium]